MTYVPVLIGSDVTWRALGLPSQGHIEFAEADAIRFGPFHVLRVAASRQGVGTWLIPLDEWASPIAATLNELQDTPGVRPHRLWDVVVPERRRQKLRGLVPKEPAALEDIRSVYAWSYDAGAAPVVVDPGEFTWSAVVAAWETQVGPRTRFLYAHFGRQMLVEYRHVTDIVPRDDRRVVFVATGGSGIACTLPVAAADVRGYGADEVGCLDAKGPTPAELNRAHQISAALSLTGLWSYEVDADGHVLDVRPTWEIRPTTALPLVADCVTLERIMRCLR